MPVKQSHYETLLAQYSNQDSAIALLKKHRPYLEMLPSLRRPQESLITLPLPVARIRHAKSFNGQMGESTPSDEAVRLPCDLAILMCDPEWKIKMGVEILVFIHRPHEDFSNLLIRWRESQVNLHRNYEWLMPPRHQHILSEGSDSIYPLFVIFDQTPHRIRRGLEGACLPYVLETPTLVNEEEMVEALPTEG